MIFHEARAAEDKRAVEEGIAAVEGAVAFVRDLPPGLPKAICSSSSSYWVESHLRNLGLDALFAGTNLLRQRACRARQAGAGPLSARGGGVARTDRGA